MGWHKIKELEHEFNDLEDPGSAKAGLWTRGGCEGVKVSLGNEWIDIPRQLLYELVGQELRDREISRLEGLDGAGMIEILRR